MAMNPKARIGLLLAATLSTACATTGEPSADAVMCAKCETVWVQGIDPNDPYEMEYVSYKERRCPDCRSAVATFFATGEFEHTCETCGGELVHCTLHD